jgi:hypothetical protein
MKYLKFSALTMMVAVLSIAIASAYNAVGSFNGWNNNDGALVMLDNGTNGDAVAGDNIFTCQTSIATAGSYEWKNCEYCGTGIPVFLPEVTAGSRQLLITR